MRKSILAVTLFAALGARANLDLTVQVDRVDEKKHERQTLHVTLGDTWFRWDDGKMSGTYDLRTRHIVRVNREKHELYDESLFAHVRGREIELQNREMLGKALEAGDVADNPLALPLAEHQLSLRSESSGAPGITPQTQDGERRFLWKNKELAAWSLDHYPATESERAQFVRFFRLTWSGHPAILEELQKTDGIPKHIRIADGLTGTAHIDISDVKQSPDAPKPAPPAEAKEIFRDRELGAAIAKIRASTPQSREQALRATAGAAVAAVDANRPLEGILGFLEVRLARGSDLPQEFQERKDAILADQNVKALLASLSPKNEEEAKAAIKTLTGLMKPAGPKAYVVQIFRANIETETGDSNAAGRDFRDALAKNPLITGVWKDLGDLQWQGYDAAAAWQSYEAARLIAPEHPILQEIAETEARLVRDHPEFF